MRTEKNAGLKNMYDAIPKIAKGINYMTREYIQKKDTDLQMYH